VFVAAYIIVMNATFYITSIMNSTNGLTTVFNVMLYSLAIIVPILTMRTFSEDYKQKTDQLLLTSPVSPSGIVLGKFFAAFLVFVFGLVLTIIYVIICQAFGTVNMASVVGNYVAILGVAAVYISIGVFISSLTENQLISAIATLAVFALLLILDLCYNLVNTSWIKAVLYWLSIYRRYNTFIMGVFSLADFVYYISVTAVFLFLTVRMLEKKRWS
jgi:ABC-2 type transport system permease protein